MLNTVLPHTTRHFDRAIIMPNLVPPVVRADDARAYRIEFWRRCPRTPRSRPHDAVSDRGYRPRGFGRGLYIRIDHRSKTVPCRCHNKLASGVRNFEKVRHVLDKMAEIGCPLCVHGEVTHDDIDIFDREAAFIDTVLDPIAPCNPRVARDHGTYHHKEWCGLCPCRR